MFQKKFIRWHGMDRMDLGPSLMARPWQNGLSQTPWLLQAMAAGTFDATVLAHDMQHAEAHFVARKLAVPTRPSEPGPWESVSAPHSS